VKNQHQGTVEDLVREISTNRDSATRTSSVLIERSRSTECGDNGCRGNIAVLAVVGELTEEQGNVIHHNQGSVEVIVEVMRMNSRVAMNRSAQSTEIGVNGQCTPPVPEPVVGDGKEGPGNVMTPGPVMGENDARDRR